MIHRERNPITGRYFPSDNPLNKKTVSKQEMDSFMECYDSVPESDDEVIPSD